MMVQELRHTDKIEITKTKLRDKLVCEFDNYILSINILKLHLSVKFLDTIIFRYFNNLIKVFLNYFNSFLHFIK